MSLEIRAIAHIRCDQMGCDWSYDGRCTDTYGADRQFPANDDMFEVMARQANEAGWSVGLVNGVRGWSAMAICPDHNEVAP